MRSACIRAVLALLVGVVAGCAGIRAIVPQQSTIMNTRDKMGMPTDIRFDRNGDELWEYATGPMGEETYLVRIGSDGIVKTATRLLTTEQFNKIFAGRTTKPEVRNFLGRPSDVAFFDGEAVWEWRIRVDPNPARFIVRFTRDGIVRDTMTLLDISGDDGHGGKGGRGTRGGRGGGRK